MEYGFHVSLVKSYSLVVGDSIQFDDIVTNIGNAFNKATGKFTCPVDGTYVFSTSIVCDKLDIMHVAVLKNGKPMFNSLCDNRSGNSWNQGGGMTILSLNSGDTVHLGVIWPNRAVKAYGNGMTSFSGYLLHARV